MKTKRLKRIKLDGRSHYHVISRIVERRFYLDENEKRVFCDMLERVARFSGVHVLTYCIMDNHFHLLIEVPERELLTLEEVKKRLPLIYRGNDLKRVMWEFMHWEKSGNEHMIEELKQQYERRMFDLSEFMKTLKQRFSIWYNRSHDNRKGTLWEEDRFVSVLIQSPRKRHGDMGNLAILTIAAYIELNPVRAGIVDDPENYLWCGYGAAVAGMSGARDGINVLMGYMRSQKRPWDVASRAYRKHLFVQERMRGGISQIATRNIINADGCLSRAELLYRRIRYFSSGRVIGEEEFVNRTIAQNGDCFSVRRNKGCCHMRGGNWEWLCAGKDCR